MVSLVLYFCHWQELPGTYILRLSYAAVYAVCGFGFPSLPFQLFSDCIVPYENYLVIVKLYNSRSNYAVVTPSDYGVRFVFHYRITCL